MSKRRITAEARKLRDDANILLNGIRVTHISLRNGYIIFSIETSESEREMSVLHKWDKDTMLTVLLKVYGREEFVLNQDDLDTFTSLLCSHIAEAEEAAKGKKC